MILYIDNKYVDIFILTIHKENAPLFIMVNTGYPAFKLFSRWDAVPFTWHRGDKKYRF